MSGDSISTEIIVLWQSEARINQKPIFDGDTADFSMCNHMHTLEITGTTLRSVKIRQYRHKR
jgi:hypothetical protein